MTLANGVEPKIRIIFIRSPTYEIHLIYDKSGTLSPWANLLKRYHRKTHVQQAFILDEASPSEDFVSTGLNNVQTSVVDEDLETKGVKQLPLTHDDGNYLNIHSIEGTYVNFALT